MELEHINWGRRQKKKKLMIPRVGKGMGNGKSQTLGVHFSK